MSHTVSSPPHPPPRQSLSAGQVGYVITGIRDPKEAAVGDTLAPVAAVEEGSVVALPGFKRQQPMVFASLYPTDSSDFNHLAACVEKLTLNDASVTVSRESSDALGTSACTHKRATVCCLLWTR